MIVDYEKGSFGRFFWVGLLSITTFALLFVLGIIGLLYHNHRCKTKDSE
jgi:hypothetical protein